LPVGLLQSDGPYGTNLNADLAFVAFVLVDDCLPVDKHDGIVWTIVNALLPFATHASGAYVLVYGCRHAIDLTMEIMTPSSRSYP
jgi:hypothetical protein